MSVLLYVALDVLHRPSKFYETNRLEVGHCEAENENESKATTVCSPTGELQSS